MSEQDPGLAWELLARCGGIGDGLHVDKPVEGGEKAPTRRLTRRLVQDGNRTFTAYSADELIELESYAHYGRPGHPF